MVAAAMAPAIIAAAMVAAAAVSEQPTVQRVDRCDECGSWKGGDDWMYYVVFRCCTYVDGRTWGRRAGAGEFYR